MAGKKKKVPALSSVCSQYFSFKLKRLPYHLMTGSTASDKMSQICVHYNLLEMHKQEALLFLFLFMNSLLLFSLHTG